MKKCSGLPDEYPLFSAGMEVNVRAYDLAFPALYHKPTIYINIHNGLYFEVSRPTNLFKQLRKDMLKQLVTAEVKDVEKTFYFKWLGNNTALVSYPAKRFFYFVEGRTNHIQRVKYIECEYKPDDNRIDMVMLDKNRAVLDYNYMVANEGENLQWPRDLTFLFMLCNYVEDEIMD